MALFVGNGTNSVDEPIGHLVLLGVHNDAGVLRLHPVRGAAVLARTVRRGDAVRLVRVSVTLRQRVLYARVHVRRRLLLLLPRRVEVTRSVVVRRVRRRATRECPLLVLLLLLLR